MKKVILILTLLIIAGCSEPKDIYDQQIKECKSGNKIVLEVTQCIQEVIKQVGEVDLERAYNLCDTEYRNAFRSNDRLTDSMVASCKIIARDKELIPVKVKTYPFNIRCYDLVSNDKMAELLGIWVRTISEDIAMYEDTSSDCDYIHFQSEDILVSISIAKGDIEKERQEHQENVLDFGEFGYKHGDSIVFFKTPELKITIKGHSNNLGQETTEKVQEIAEFIASSEYKIGDKTY